MFLLDTNVISDAVAARPNAGVRDWLAHNDAAQLFISVVTIGELHKGVTMARRLNATRAMRLDHWAASIEQNQAWPL